MTAYRPGQAVIVRDPMRRRTYRGTVMYSTQNRTATAWTDEGWMVRFLDEHGRTVETHRRPDELSPVPGEVFSPQTRMVWHALRAGARKSADCTLAGVRTRIYRGAGWRLLVTT